MVTWDSFSRKIDRRTSWRKREISQFILVTQDLEREADIKTHCRAGLVMLYSHWEGWVKEVGRAYLEFVNGKKLSYSQLSDSFLAIAIKTEISRVDISKKSRLHNEFVHFLRRRQGEIANISLDLIDAKSNLDSSVLRDIVSKLGIESEFYSNLCVCKSPVTSSECSKCVDNLKKNIDSRLLSWRNSIAHGGGNRLRLCDLVALRDYVIRVLDMYSDLVLDVSANESYRVDLGADVP